MTRFGDDCATTAEWHDIGPDTKSLTLALLKLTSLDFYVTRLLESTVYVTDIDLPAVEAHHTLFPM